MRLRSVKQNIGSSRRAVKDENFCPVDGRARIAVSLAGQGGWMVSFMVSQPPTAGEVRMETRKALRDRGRRSPSYRRAKTR